MCRLQRRSQWRCGRDPTLPPGHPDSPFPFISEPGYAGPGDSVSHLISGQQAPFLPKRPGGGCCHLQPRQRMAQTWYLGRGSHVSTETVWAALGDLPGGAQASKNLPIV